MSKPIASASGSHPISVSGQVTRALRLKGWSVAEAAARTGLTPEFLSRIIGGQTPPRARLGRRTASEDDRYHKLASCLALGESFIRDAEKLQTATPTAPGEKLEELRRLVLWDLGGAVSEEYRGEVEGLIGRFVRAAETPGKVDELGREILARLPKAASCRARRAAPGGYDGTLKADEAPVGPRYFVPFPGWLDNPGDHEARQVLIRVGEAFLACDGPVSKDVRAEVAGLFFLVATRARSSWPRALEIAREVLGPRG